MSCIILTPTGGTAHNNGNITNVIIEDNWFDYGIISVNCGSMSAGDSVTLKRNKFGSHMTQPGTPRPVELDHTATNTIGTGADKNYYTATGNEIAYFYG